MSIDTNFEDDNFERLFQQPIRVKVDRPEKPEIIALPAYFERIVREGYYINQVNYELMRFFYLRNIQDNVSRASMPSLGIPEANLMLENYNSMQHVSLQTPVEGKDQGAAWCLTSMMRELNTILDDGGDDAAHEERNKYIMICNIRPEPNKFRMGALQTLELVKMLSST